MLAGAVLGSLIRTRSGCSLAGFFGSGVQKLLCALGCQGREDSHAPEAAARPCRANILELSDVVVVTCSAGKLVASAAAMPRERVEGYKEASAYAQHTKSSAELVSVEVAAWSMSPPGVGKPAWDLTPGWLVA